MQSSKIQSELVIKHKMPPKKQPKMRIRNLPKDYKFLGFLNLSLNSPNPKLDYFQFANTFRGTKRATNNHYLDLLHELSTNQSNRLLKIAANANALFATREDDCEFGHKYKEYWEKRSRNSLRRSMEKENSKTVAELNKITNRNIRALAEETSSSNGIIADYESDNSIDGESENEKRDDNGDDDTEGGELEENELEEEELEGTGMDNVLNQMSNLPSNEVGQLRIIDLSSEAVAQIFKSEISVEAFNTIISATSIQPITLSEHASQLVNALETSPLSLSVLRETLYEHGYKKGFDFIQHSDVGFAEVTIRHFLDLMSSPKNPLNQNILERTAATYFIIFIVNQLFLSDNDIIELGWLEREFFVSEKTKWDGILFKVGNKSSAAGLVEFSGGCHDNTTNKKQQRDITKLYSNLLKVINTQTSSKEQTFCIRYYQNYIYLEKLTRYDDLFFRSIHATIQVPNSPRKVVEYVKQIPDILAWKQAVVKHALDLQ